MYGIIPNHAKDVSGPQDISLTTFQPIAVYFLGGGWTPGTAGMLKYDWHGKQWTVPLNLGLSRTIKPGRTPWKIGLEVNYHVERSDRPGQEWMIGLNISPVVPNVFAWWLGLSK